MKSSTLVAYALALQGAFAFSAKDCLLDLRLAADGSYSIFKQKYNS
jgi:hypothetical protein